VKARVHPDQISEHATSLQKFHISTIRVPAPSPRQITGTVANPKRGKGAQHKSVLAPNYSQIRRIYARRALQASDLADRARTNPRSSTRDRQSGSSRISEHHPKKKKSEEEQKSGENSHRSRISRTTNTQLDQAGQQHSWQHARLISQKKKKARQIGNPNLLGAGAVLSCARRNGVVGGKLRMLRWTGRSSVGTFYSGTRARGYGQRANGTTPRRRRWAHTDTPRARRGWAASVSDTRGRQTSGTRMSSAEGEMISAWWARCTWSVRISPPANLSLPRAAGVGKKSSPWVWHVGPVWLRTIGHFFLPQGNVLFV